MTDDTTSAATTGTRPRKWFARWDHLAIALLLVLHAALGCDTARRLSPTHDEFWHLPIGLWNWRTGRFHYDDLNPPLTRMWSALPLLMGGADAGTVPGDQPPGAFGEAFLRANPDRFPRWFARGRCMNVLLSAATGLLLAVWARQLFGRRAACLTVLLWTCCPNVIAHAAVVTSDLGAAFFFLTTWCGLWRFARQPNWRRAIGFGAVLGFAQLAKFTAVLLYPLAPVGWLLLRRNLDSGAIRTRLGVKWLAAFLISLLVLNAGYLFQGTGQPPRSYRFQSPELGVLNRVPDWLRWVPIPLPREYLTGFDHQRTIMRQPHPVYLDAEWSTTGFPAYYLKTLLYKLPHPTQLLIVVALLGVVLRLRERRDGWTQLAILFPAVALVGIASLGGMQLGIRYVLPALPFLFVFAGQVAEWLDWRHARLLTVGLLVLLALVPLSLRYHPNHLAYFNELAGGPIEGRWHLLDSNLDWGQDLDGLAEYLHRHNIDDIGLAYFGTVPPDVYGIRYHLPPPHQPRPGLYAVSVNFVMGRPHVLRAPDGRGVPVGLDEFGYFRSFTPKDRIGDSIDIYEITPADVVRWRIDTALP